MLRVTHLMCNIYNCIHGDKSPGVNKYNIRPPVLNDYLRL